MITFAWAICTGGLYISEHPAPPHDDTIASVWTSPWTQVLRAHPDVALHIVGQWRWGCEVKKPTGLMTLRLPRFLSSMYGRALDDAKPPDAVAIGIGSDGRFRTSSLKEYPPAFCSALAGSLIDEIKRRKASGSCHSQGEPDLSLYSGLARQKRFVASFVKVRLGSQIFRDGSLDLSFVPQLVALAARIDLWCHGNGNGIVFPSAGFTPWSKNSHERGKAKGKGIVKDGKGKNRKRRGKGKERKRKRKRKKKAVSHTDHFWCQKLSFSLSFVNPVCVSFFWKWLQSSKKVCSDHLPGTFLVQNLRHYDNKQWKGRDQKH